MTIIEENITAIERAFTNLKEFGIDVGTVTFLCDATTKKIISSLDNTFTLGESLVKDGTFVFSFRNASICGSVTIGVDDLYNSKYLINDSIKLYDILKEKQVPLVKIDTLSLPCPVEKMIDALPHQFEIEHGGYPEPFAVIKWDKREK